MLCFTCIVNSVASLLNERVYAIPIVFVIGWRGEPGVHDEPQHIYQGMVTRKLLDDMEIENVVLSSETFKNELEGIMKDFRECLKKGKSVAFVVRKGALTFEEKIEYKKGQQQKQ